MTSQPDHQAALQPAPPNQTMSGIREYQHLFESLRASEEKFAAFFQLSPIPMTITSVADGSFRDVNEAFVRVSGYSREEAIGSSSLKLGLFANPADRIALAEQIQSLGLVTAAPIVYRTKQGDLLDTLTSASVVTIGGQPYFIAGITDITALKRAEAAVHDQHASMAALLENIDGSIWSVDRDYRLIAGNSIFHGNIQNLLGSAFTIGESVLSRSNAGELNSIWRSHYDRTFLGEKFSIETPPRVDHSSQWMEYRFNPIRDSAGQISGVTVFGRNITERKVAEESQREQEERFRLAFENANDGVCLVGLDGHLLRVNARMGEIFGYSRQELEQMTVNDLAHPDHVEISTKFISQAVHEHSDHTVFEKLYIHRDGRRVWGQVSSSLVRNDRGDPLYFISHVQDITERKRIEREREQLQAQLMQAQKMEVIGRLAGGIAHDFNNMLAVMMLRTEMAMQLVDANSLLHRNLAGVYATAQRSANLVRQLLGFARKQTIAPESLDLNAVVEGALPMLRKLIEEGIEVAWRPGANLWPLRMDPSQIDQILTNLCVNASDAIGSVGTITIETRNIELDQSAIATGLTVAPGEYVMLVVNDTGSGMDEKTLTHIFEPFFTTKEIGKGTGLGLATVEGIVQQNEGQVRVYSKPGVGTAFQIYLPRNDGEMAEQPEVPNQQPQARVRGQGELVLLVEDETAVLQMGVEALQHLGYQVVSAATPGEALALANANAGRIALLITDVIMPEMNGGELARRIESIQPDIRQLFVSGYSADFITRRGMLEQDTHFLQKPFALNTLAQKVSDALA